MCSLGNSFFSEDSVVRVENGVRVGAQQTVMTRLIQVLNLIKGKINENNKHGNYEQQLWLGYVEQQIPASTYKTVRAFDKYSTMDKKVHELICLNSYSYYMLQVIFMFL